MSGICDTCKRNNDCRKPIGGMDSCRLYESGKESNYKKLFDTPEQAIAATIGRPKAKSHPYGYEPDTGAFDCTRCECGCINDISATYCNDCGGEIEVDMNAEKELYHHPRNSVFAEKHDDGSLEFGGKRYKAATLGSEREKALEELVQDWQALYEEPDYGDCIRLRKRMQELGIEVDE